MMSPRTRRLALTFHIVASVGWIGAVAPFIVLDVTTVASQDVALLRAAYIGMDLMTRWAIVPLAFAALASGILMSLGANWGLFRHWWVVLTLILTVAATIVLLVQVPLIAHRAEVAADPAATDQDLRGLGNFLLHSIGGTVVLLVITVLNIYKPRGLTAYGWRKQREATQARPSADAASSQSR
jgi:hypothetical protein